MTVFLTSKKCASKRMPVLICLRDLQADFLPDHTPDAGPDANFRARLRLPRFGNLETSTGDRRWVGSKELVASQPTVQGIASLTSLKPMPLAPIDIFYRLAPHAPTLPLGSNHLSGPGAFASLKSLAWSFS